MACLAVGVGAYGMGLVATAPARAVDWAVDMPRAVRAVSGTIWRGSAVLQGGYVAEWEVSPWASLAALRLEGDWTIAGPEMRIAGHARIAPGQVEVTSASGSLGWDVVDAVLPDLPFRCDPSARIEIASLRVSGEEITIAGTAQSGPGRCADDLGVIDVPGLLAKIASNAEGIDLKITRRDTPGQALGDIRLLRTGRLVVTVQPQGARLVPGLPTSGPTVLELPIALTALTPPDR